MNLYELKQGDHSLGVRPFADTKRFVLRCCLPTMRNKVVRAKRITTLSSAIKGWAMIERSK